MGLQDPMSCHCLCHSADRVVLQVARRNMVRVPCDERHIFAFLILQANLPSIQEFRPRLDVRKLCILEWPL